MNVMLDPSLLMGGFLNVMLLIVGILIKIELHDIKGRITRLEDVFINSSIKETL